MNEKKIQQQIKEYENAITKLKEELTAKQSNNQEKYKLYKGTVLSAIKDCLADGRRPLTIKEVYDLRKSGKIENVWYDTGTIYFKGEIRNVTIEELKNIEETYKKGGRLLYLGLNDYDGFVGNYYLGDGGRFVGVKVPKAHGRKK